MKSIVFVDNDFKATSLDALSGHLPANNVLLPDCTHTMKFNKIVSCAGYHELA